MAIQTKVPTTAQAPATTGVAPTTAQAPVEPETYDMFIPLLPGKHQPDFQGSVNGVPFQLPRGEIAKLPRHVYEVVRNTLKNEQSANQKYYQAQAKLLSRAKDEEKRIIGEE